MSKLLFSLCALLFTVPAFARTSDFDGMVNLPNGLKVYAIHYKAVGNAPTVVFLNGLTYDTTPWQKSAQELLQKNYGVLMYDMRGMGKTLTAPVDQIIPLEQQADDLALLLNARGLDRVSLAGLSYGGAVGLAFAKKYPARVDKLLLMAPYVRALESQDQYLTQQTQIYQFWHPYDNRPYDEIYDEDALQPFIYQTYGIVEPSVLKNPYSLGAVYQMVRGVRKFVATKIADDLSGVKIHLIMAGKDQYVPATDHLAFWASLPEGSKLSRIVMADSEHKMPEVIPHFLAAWLDLCLSGDARLSNNAVFDGQPANGTASSGSVVIEGLTPN
jgi:pimeloyl-ACP methyl ester carboxylesterase